MPESFHFIIDFFCVVCVDVSNDVFGQVLHFDDECVRFWIRVVDEFLFIVVVDEFLWIVVVDTRVSSGVKLLVM